MRYEDMLAEPQKIFGGLARHLLFNPNEAELADAIDRSSFERLRGTGQWKEALSAESKSSALSMRTVSKWRAWLYARVEARAPRATAAAGLACRVRHTGQTIHRTKRLRPAPGGEQRSLFEINKLHGFHDAFHVFSTVGRSSTRCHSSRGTTWA